MCKWKVWVLSVCALFLLASGVKLKAETSDSVRISLLTCSPGTEIYSLFGHTALRYEDPRKGLDIVFNYGMFSFNTPNFIWRFVKGETDYQLGVTEYRYFEGEYAMRGSAVYQQALNLLPAEKEKLWQILENNYRKENRTYRYNCLFDNCTTRARDRVEDCIEGKIVYNEDNRPLTFRDIIHQYTKGYEWSEFGIDLCLGSGIDEPIDYRKKMFAPFYLLNAVDGARILGNDGSERLLAGSVTEIIPPGAQDSERFLLTPMQAGWLLFVFTLLISIYGVWRRKMLWGVDIVLFGAAGLAGCVIAFLVFFSVHPAVSPNYLLLCLNPIHLFYLPFMVYFSIKRKKDWYHWVNLAVLTLFISLFWLMPQKFNPAVLPLAASLWIRSASHLILMYKKR